jgi:hypothetical protein
MRATAVPPCRRPTYAFLRVLLPRDLLPDVFQFSDSLSAESHSMSLDGSLSADSPALPESPAQLELPSASEGAAELDPFSFACSNPLPLVSSSLPPLPLFEVTNAPDSPLVIDHRADSPSALLPMRDARQATTSKGGDVHNSALPDRRRPAIRRILAAE